MEEKVLELYAFASSLEEEKKHRAKFPALAVREVTEKAYKQGAFRSDGYYKPNGYRLLRSIYYVDQCKFVNRDGQVAHISTDNSHAGTCVAFRTIYNPNSKLVRTMKTKDIYSVVYNPNKGFGAPDSVISDNVPIVIFGGKEYVWFNREECEKAYARGWKSLAIMDCESLYLEERAEAFDETGKSNDYAVATKQQKQYERILLENATDEEKTLLCKVRMSSKDNYESLEIIPPETDVQKILGQIATQEKIIDDAYTIIKDLRQKLALATGFSLNLSDATENKQKDDEAE